MVFITGGMSLRIPAGGLRIPLDGSEPPPLLVEVRLDTWHHWLRIALDHIAQAEQAHIHLLQPDVLADDSAKARALENEFKAAMPGICAAAFSLDAFYGSVKQLAPVSPDIERAWKRNKTSRHRRIGETLRRAFRVQNDDMASHQIGIGEVFRFRDWAVHPPAEFTRPVLHPDLGVGVEWRFVAFSASNCQSAGRVALRLLTSCASNPRPKWARLSEWCQFSGTVVRSLVDEWERRYGPL